MSGFLSRWADRKKAVRQEAEREAEQPVDLAALPPVETLHAASDMRLFLQKGIPAALQTQALRIAWEQDAAIAGFRGMAEYDWDFNAEGYGRLGVSDDVAALLRRVLAPDPDPAPPAPSVAEGEDVAIAATEPAAIPPAPVDLQPRPETGNVTDASPGDVPVAVRRHGGALPS